MIVFTLLATILGLATAMTFETYYEPVAPYSMPSAGYILPAYVPPYAAYHVAPSVHYTNEHQQPRKYEEKEEPKYYYGGKFKGICSNDGLYYKDEVAFVICSNGYPSEQPCPPGTKTSGYPSYKPGYYYGYTDLCSVNLVDYGYAPSNYAPDSGEYDEDNIEYKDKLYGYVDKDDHSAYQPPRKDTYVAPMKVYSPTEMSHQKPTYSRPIHKSPPSPYSSAKNPYVPKRIDTYHPHSPSKYPKKDSYLSDISRPSKDSHSDPNPYYPKNNHGKVNPYPPSSSYQTKDYRPKQTGYSTDSKAAYLPKVKYPTEDKKY